MSNRILDISDSPARLCVRHRQLVIDREGQSTVTLPMAEMAVIVVAHPQVSYTQAVLAELLECGGVFVACNDRRLPIGMLLPLSAHFTQTERFALQAQASLPIRKRLWQQIVRAKIQAQAATLSDVRGSDSGLAALLPLVKSGDPQNVEARAARRYWSVLFPGIDFHRDPDAEDHNKLLNYGYAVLRGIVARAICAAGLHPSLGLHHHNRYNAFCLADDLMEPFRPVVDRVVAQRVDQFGSDVPLDGSSRRALIEAITGRCSVGGEVRTLFDAAARMASSLAAVFMNEQSDLILPEQVILHGQI